MPYVICLAHSWMRLGKSSNTEVSGASEVPQSRDKLIFRKPSCCISARKLISIILDWNTYVLSTSN